jgi:hypothetical protein
MFFGNLFWAQSILKRIENKFPNKLDFIPNKEQKITRNFSNLLLFREMKNF